MWVQISANSGMHKTDFEEKRLWDPVNVFYAQSFFIVSVCALFPGSINSFFHCLLAYLHIRSVSPTLIQVLHIFNASPQGYWICHSLWIIIININGLRSNVLLQKALSSIPFFYDFLTVYKEMMNTFTFRTILLSLEKFTPFHFYCSHTQNIHPELTPKLLK